MPATPKIILYHYPFSPYARKVFWYLRLRSIPFTQCLQPPILPRPDLSQQLGITYRRIPICAIDKDIYCDTSLILRELSLRFPYCTPQACGGKEILADVDELAVGGMHAKMIMTLVENWADEDFVVAGRLLPANLPLLKDEGFRKDRGRFWAKGSMGGTRYEALASMRRLFHTVEMVFLAGDKKWILGSDKPTIVDLMAIWPLDWVTTVPNALCPDPTDPSSKPLITPQSHPLTFSWISRFQSLLKSLPPAKSSVPTISGPDAKLSILSSEYSSSGVVSVDELDPLGLKSGDIVEVVPTDSGVLDPQRGKLVGLEVTKVAVEVEVPGYGGKETVRVWFPRRNYKITKVGEKAKI